MSAREEKHATAEALYKAIRTEVEKIDQYGGGHATILETLARAYSLVAETNAPDPNAPKGRRGAVA